MNSSASISVASDAHDHSSAIENRGGRYLPPWQIGKMPDPPAAGWKLWIGLIGPGIVLAGTSIGSGEWLFGPAVTAQYGATLLWLALTSILFQAFCNLMMMRYAVYCGEPIIVGGLRTSPGPKFWLGTYAILDIAGIWPYNASNAAVPLAAVILGHLPQTAADQSMVKTLGFLIFILAFVPLIFGGTVYRMLEKIMTAKLVLVLGYLSLVAIMLVSWPVIGSVAAGFLKFGVVPLRADSIAVDRNFNMQHVADGVRYVVKGTFEQDGQPTGELTRTEGTTETKYNLRQEDGLPTDVSDRRTRALTLARYLSKPGRFWFETKDGETLLSAEGDVLNYHQWNPTHLFIDGAGGPGDFLKLADVPEPYASKFRNILEHEGVEDVSLLGYVRDHGKLPNLDWATIVAFIGIAGAGGLSNTLFSNYARDKGWGMGARVGAIPSAIGGRTIGLSHIGCTFEPVGEDLARWKGWIRHIVRDQGIWVVASILGMALPCMMSLEFIRNVTVSGDRVAAMSAEGIALRYPGLGAIFWILTLSCGFLVLAPGQVSVGDQIARRWTDMLWTASSTAKWLGRGEVRYIYYGILAVYGVWGLFVLWLLPALQIAKIGAVLGNVALGISTLQALHVNRTLLPPALRPNLFLQIGTGLCGLFFLGISIVLVFTL